MKDIFNDVLTTDRRRFNDKVIDKPVVDQDDSLNFSRMSFFLNPTHISGDDSKPFPVSSKYIQKKIKTRKNSYSDELTQLLALAEIRFLDNANKLKEAIVANKNVYILRIIFFIKKVYPIIKKLRRTIVNLYMYKWIIVHKECKPDKVKSTTFTLWSFRKMLDKISQRNKLRALIIFKERGIMHEIALQYYGIDTIYKKKLSNYVPPLAREETNKSKLDKLIKNKK